ncbi:MAG: glycosyltransferase 87 family protein, partial [Candidatus Omnitrophica bacterium]|nr:glycosyltransferase 87 family protein [Candidatus Omnitrophota bacterium]
MILAGVTAVLGWLVLFPALYCAGSFFGPLLKEEDPLMRGVLKVACGLGLFAYFMVGIGTAGLLNVWFVIAFVLLVYGLRWHALGEFKSWLVSIRDRVFAKGGWFCFLCQTALVFSVLFAFGLCFLPEIANDALCYQLNLPKLFVQNRSTLPLVFDLNSYMPLLAQHGYAAGLLFHSVAMAKLFHFVAGLLLFLACFQVIYAETGRRVLALFFALMLWLTPTVINQVTTTYVDVTVALFTFLALHLFLRGLQLGRSGIFLLSGLLFGLAVSTKLLAAMGGLPFAVLILLMFLRREHKAKMTGHAAAFAAGALLACGFWFVRNVWLVHNPVYPYFGEIFGTWSF